MRALTVAAALSSQRSGTLPGRDPPPRGGAAGDGGLSAHAARRTMGAKTPIIRGLPVSVNDRVLGSSAKTQVAFLTCQTPVETRRYGCTHVSILTTLCDRNAAQGFGGFAPRQK